MSEAFIFRLPQELIDGIIGHVIALEDGRHSIPACALTCRAFLPRSQKQLFSTIKLVSDIGRQGHRVRRLKQFLDILQNSAVIAKYVRAVHLSISSFDSGWLAECPLFGALMLALNESGCQPEELEMEGLDPFFPPTFPAAFNGPTTFNDNIFHPFFAPYITSLRLSTLDNIPSTLITSCSKLRSLKLVCADVITSDIQFTLEMHPSLPYPRIEVLEFDRPTGAMEVVLDSFEGSTALVDLSHLRILTSTVNLQNAAYVARIIKNSADHLEEVKLRCSCEYGTFYYAEENEIISPFDFSCVPHLRILSMNIAAETTPSFQTAPKILENVITILASVPSANVFERLNFCAYLDLSEFESFFRDNPCWEHFDTEVIRVSAGKSLVVNFGLHILSGLPRISSQGNSDEDSVRALKKLIEDCLPRCKRAPHINLGQITYVNRIA